MAYSPWGRQYTDLLWHAGRPTEDGSNISISTQIIYAGDGLYKCQGKKSCPENAVLCMGTPQSEYLVLSPRTSQKKECFFSHPELNKGQFSHQASGSLCLSTSRDRKPAEICPQCLKAGVTPPLQCLMGGAACLAKTKASSTFPAEPAHLTIHSRRVKSRRSPGLSITFCINRH